MFPLAVWQPGTLQPSTPVNDNALRVEVLQRGAISILGTPPGSPADGDVHIVGASPTGAWSTFAQHDVVMWRSGTWYRFAPFTGWLKQVGSDVRRFSGTAWEVVTGGGGGGAVPVQDEGATVVATPTAINFVGDGVTATNSGGVAIVTIPGSSGPAYVTNTRARAFFYALPGSSSTSIFGFASPAQTGTPTGFTINAATIWGSQARIGYNAAASTTAVAGVRDGIGGGPYLSRVGGYELRFRAGPSTGATVASHRLFFGLRASLAAPTDVEPSTLVNVIGLGYESSDTQVQIIHNDATGTATKIALGASFPKPTTADSAIYDLTLTCAPGASSVSYVVREMISGATASGTISADMPASTTLLSWGSQMSAGGTSTAISLVVFGIYLEYNL